MSKKVKIWLIFVILTAVLTIVRLFGQDKLEDDRLITFIVQPEQDVIKMYWKDDDGNRLKSIGRLQEWLASKNQQLIFAMNGGMYLPDGTPQGLFIEDNIQKTPIDTAQGTGNFYLMPNGIFYITNENRAVVTATASFQPSTNIRYATQSGPMLVIEGNIHPAFKQGSTNLHIRNGVGILPDNKVVFAMSKKAINLYDFATYFKEIGCKNALYLDGYVSRTYLPTKNWVQTDGDFGVMIGVCTKKN